MSETPASWSERTRQRLAPLGRWTRGPLLFGAGVLAALLALLLYNSLFPGPAPLTTQQVGEVAAQVMASATPAPAASAQVYAIIRPSLVLIETEGPGTAGHLDHALGSGVIVDDQGDILTSLHVVTEATSIRLTFADGTHSNGQVVNTQPAQDIAVLRADQPPAQIVPAVLGNPNALRVGDEAFVVGNPFGLYSSMSSGVISGFNRSVNPPDGAPELRGLIQVDAAVNPGNSGGPLLNRDGAVVGIVAAILNPTGQDVFIGIGFAVPINVAGGAAGLPSY